MFRLAQTPERSSGLAAVLALLALAINLLAPPGFMVAAGPNGPAVVICTGHGPATLADIAHGQGRGGGKSKPEPACPFAGHGLASAAPPFAAAVADVDHASAPATVPRLADLAPGRGLAAPPPPSQAPPLLS